MRIWYSFIIIQNLIDVTISINILCLKNNNKYTHAIFEKFDVKDSISILTEQIKFMIETAASIILLFVLKPNNFYFLSARK